MKDSHLTTRLPAALARALARWARERGVAKSHVVREAVASYLQGSPPVASREVTAADFAARWRGLPRLAPAEAAALADDLAARGELPFPGAWE